MSNMSWISLFAFRNFFFRVSSAFNEFLNNFSKYSCNVFLILVITKQFVFSVSVYRGGLYIHPFALFYGTLKFIHGIIYRKKKQH